MAGINFGQNLKRLREAKNLSQSELARLSGLVPSAINYLEKGLRWPRPETVDALAAVLECAPDELYSAVVRTPSPVPAPAAA